MSPLLCQRRRIGRFLVRDVGLQSLGQAEVQDLDLPLGGDLHVRWLQIPVDDSLLVGCLQGVCDLQSNLEGVLYRYGTLCDPLG